MISIWHPIQKYGGAHKWKSFEYRDFTKISDNSWGNIIAVKDDQSFQKLIKVSIQICSLPSTGRVNWQVQRSFEWRVHLAFPAWIQSYAVSTGISSSHVQLECLA